MFKDAEVSPRIKLASLWASAMFCYIYADFFGLFMPGQLATMNRGEIPPLGPSTDGTMLFVALMMALPSVLIFLSIVLPARANRVVNVVMGAIYSVIIAITMWSGPAFFIFYGVIEISLTLLVCFYALTWPKLAVTSEEVD